MHSLINQRQLQMHLLYINWYEFPNLKIELLALQLNPWNKRPKQSVAKCHRNSAVIASVCRPIKRLLLLQWQAKHLDILYLSKVFC